MSEPALLQYESLKRQCQDQIVQLLGSEEAFTALPALAFDKSILELMLKKCLRMYRSEWPKLVRLFDFCIALSVAPQCHVDESFPLILIEDAVEMFPVYDCDKIFEYIESRQSELLKNLTSGRGKGLIILRILNELIRRGSKSIDSLFCGRILFFLSRIFPLNERSALNLKGAFNVDHAIVTDPPLEHDTQRPPEWKGLSMVGSSGTLEWERIDRRSALGYVVSEIVGQLDHAQDSPEMLVSYAFYYWFWKWQEYASQPGLLFDVKEWLLFHLISEDIVALISSLQPYRGMLVDISYPKYLSGRRLFRYQLRDRSFQLRLLIQLGLVLGSLHETFGFGELKDSEPSYKMKMKQAEAIESLWTRTLALIETLSDAWTRSSFLRSLTSEEVRWIGWKKASCPSYERAPEPFEITAALESCFQPQAPSADFLDCICAELHEPSSSVCGTEDLKLRRLLPEFSDHVAPLVAQMDPSEDIEKEYRLSNDSIWLWKAYRLLAAQDLERIKGLGDNANDFSQYAPPHYAMARQG